MGKPNSHEGRMYLEEGETSLSGHYTDRMRKQTLSGESLSERCIDSDRRECLRNRSIILLSIIISLDGFSISIRLSIPYCYITKIYCHCYVRSYKVL